MSTLYVISHKQFGKLQYNEGLLPIALQFSFLHL